MASLPWTLNDARTLVAGLQEDTREFGYHIALGGSVLTKGFSNKDIDLFFLPLGHPSLPKSNAKGLIGWLESLWGEATVLRKEVEAPLERAVEGRVRAPIQRVGRGVNPVPIAYNRYGPADGDGPAIAYVEEGRDVRMDEDLATNLPYEFRLRFVRTDGDRIDVNIL